MIERTAVFLRSGWRGWFSPILVAIVTTAVTVGLCRSNDPFDRIDAEGLHRSLKVESWDKSGLRLKDGSTVTVPDLRVLPDSTSPILRHALAAGMEQTPEGRIVVRVALRADGGNDEWHPTYRVDLSRFLLFLRLGIPIRRLSEAADRSRPGSPDFQEKGWAARQFLSFRLWDDLITSGRMDLFHQAR